MSYPPQPPSGQQWPGPPPQGPPQGPPPGWGPPPGPPQGPPGFPPQGPPGFGGYGGGYGGPPRKSRTGLIVGLVALAVALIVGIAVTVVLLTTGDDDGDKTAGTDPSTTPTSASSDPSASSPTDASSVTPPATPGTPYSPTDDTGDDVHSDVEASDFPGDWNFRLGDVKHDAKLLNSWDYASCGPVEEGSVLTKQRCEYAVQWTYSSLSGKVRLTHVFMVFDTQRHAKAAEAKMTNKDFDLREESVFPDFVQGKYNTSVYGNVVGITVATTKATVREKKLQSLVNYMNTDYRVALTFKQL